MKLALWMWSRAAVAMALVCASCAAAPATQPFAGINSITYEHEARENPPQHLHVVKVDLGDPRLKVRVCRAGDDPDGEGVWQTTLLQTSEIAAREGLDVAVNGDFFIPKDKVLVAGRQVPYFRGNWAQVCGMAMSDGKGWSATGGRAGLVVDERGRIAIVAGLKAVPAGARQIIGGSAQILTDGKKTANTPDRAPRTAVGVDAGHTKLVLLVVDGRRAGYSAGMTLGELADEMLRLGCADALNLDGGGSTTLVMREGGKRSWHVINRPSDGHDLPIPLSVERPVANVLGITIEGTSGR